MTNDDHPIQYEQVATTSASDLLDLTFLELDALMQVAKKHEQEARSIGVWLSCITTEKVLRQQYEDLGSPGTQPITLQNSPADFIGPAPYDQDDLANLRKRAWNQQNLLIVDPSDAQLSEREASFLTQIGERIYGKESS